jgi:hypothetical protein
LRGGAYTNLKQYAVLPKNGKATGPGDPKKGEKVLENWPLCAKRVMFHLCYAGAWPYDAPLMRAASIALDWATAADELRKSKYCKQVKERRCGELVSRLRDCAAENPLPPAPDPGPDGGNGLETPVGPKSVQPVE